MTGNAVHRLERKSQTLLKHRVADALRREMDRRGLTAKELSRVIEIETTYRLDYRTIQHAMAQEPSCSLDTFEVLVAAFGWDFADTTIEPVVGASRLASLEREYEQQRAKMAALDRTIAVHREADLARRTVDGGRLRLVAPEDRAFRP